VTHAGDFSTSAATISSADAAWPAIRTRMHVSRIGTRCALKGDMAPLRVLVVDDEPLIRWAVAEAMTDAGHEVVQAANGTAALQAIGGTPEPFHVVLLDYRLPDSDDLSLLQWIRRVSPISAVVMMTAFSTTPMKTAAKDLGAYEVVGKPFDVAAMTELLVHAHQNKTA
jgi:two-component system NtrC family response regulator